MAPSPARLGALMSLELFQSYAGAQRTFPLSSAPYGGFSSAPRRAPSLSPPRSSCRNCWALFWTSAVDTGCTAGARELRSKLAGLSGSKASMLIVRQLMLAMVVVVEFGYAGYIGCREVPDVVVVELWRGAIRRACIRGVQCQIRSPLYRQASQLPIEAPAARLAKHPPCSTGKGRRSIRLGGGSIPLRLHIYMPVSEIRGAT